MRSIVLEIYFIRFFSCLFIYYSFQVSGLVLQIEFESQYCEVFENDEVQKGLENGLEWVVKVVEGKMQNLS